RERVRRDLRERKPERERREREDGGDDECHAGPAQLRVHRTGQLAEHEPPQAPSARRRLAVDERVRCGDEVVETFGRDVAREIAPRDRKVRGRGAIEPPELEDLIRLQPTDAATCRRHELTEPCPSRAPILDETVDRHGRERSMTAGRPNTAGSKLRPRTMSCCVTTSPAAVIAGSRR